MTTLRAAGETADLEQSAEGTDPGFRLGRTRQRGVCSSLRTLLTSCPQLFTLKVKSLPLTTQDLKAFFGALAGYKVRYLELPDCPTVLMQQVPLLSNMEGIRLGCQQPNTNSGADYSQHILWFARRNRTLKSLRLHNIGPGVAGLTRWALHFPLLEELTVTAEGPCSASSNDAVAKQLVQHALKALCPKLRKVTVAW